MKHLHDIPEAKTWFDQMFVSTAPLNTYSRYEATERQFEAYREAIREMTYRVRVPANAQWLTITTADGYGRGGTTTIRRG